MPKTESDRGYPKAEFCLEYGPDGGYCMRLRGHEDHDYRKPFTAEDLANLPRTDFDVDEFLALIRDEE